MKSRAGILAAMVAAAGIIGGNLPHNSSFAVDTKRITGDLPDKPIPKGAKLYEYDDGFKCIAISQKSADKKRNKYLSK